MNSCYRYSFEIVTYNEISIFSLFFFVSAFIWNKVEVLSLFIMEENMNTINSFNDLCVKLGYSHKQLRFILFNKKTYTSVSVPKKDGGERVLNIPSKEIKELQRNLLEILDSNFKSHYNAHGYINNKSIVTNASRHIGNQYILNVDLENFFDRITFPRVRSMFINYFKINPSIATVLANICCDQDNKLPQGSPTSPIVSNIILKSLDKELTKYCNRHDIVYTRYVDDITFSRTSSLIPEIFNQNEDKITLHPQINSIIKKYNFAIKDSKSRYLRSGDRLEVTGLVINEKINVNRKYIKKVRAILNSLHENLEAGKKEFETETGKDNVFQSLRGMITYIGFIRSNNKELIDSVYINLAKKYNDIIIKNTLKNQLLPLNLIGVFSLYSQTITLHTTFEDYKMSDELEIDQGTVFLMTGGVLVTNNHVISTLTERLSENYKSDIKLRKNIRIALFDAFYNRITVEIENIQYDKIIDVATLKVKDSEHINDYREFEVSQESIKLNADNYSILGFPQYTEGNGLNVTKVQVTNKEYRKIKKDSPFYTVDKQIIEGNSGGPMINKRNKLVGIAVKGTNSSSVALNQIIPIGYLDELEKNPTY